MHAFQFMADHMAERLRFARACEDTNEADCNEAHAVACPRKAILLFSLALLPGALFHPEIGFVLSFGGIDAPAKRRGR